MPDSTNFIDEKVFDDTPCLKYENISDHPLIMKIKLMDHIKKNLDLISDLKKNKAKLESFVDYPNYYFEDNKNDNFKEKKRRNS